LWLVPTLSQSGPPGIRARHGPEDSVAGSVLGTDALHPRLHASSSTQVHRGPAPKSGDANDHNRRLGNQAAGGYVVCNPADSTYELPRRAGDGGRERGQPGLPRRRIPHRRRRRLARCCWSSRTQATPLEHNLNPVGRTYYGLSTVICTPGSLAREVGLALGAQAGERQLAIVLREAGFTRVRRAAETPLSIILEARP
jgi:hypothetical protein